MGKLLISAGTSGITSDEVTASKADVLAGKTALTSDSNDEAVAGTLPDKTGTIQEGAAALDKAFRNLCKDRLPDRPDRS